MGGLNAFCIQFVARHTFMHVTYMHARTICMVSAFIVTEKDIGFEDMYKRNSNGFSIISQA